MAAGDSRAAALALAEEAWASELRQARGGWPLPDFPLSQREARERALLLCRAEAEQAWGLAERSWAEAEQARGLAERSPDEAPLLRCPQQPAPAEEGCGARRSPAPRAPEEACDLERRLREKSAEAEEAAATIVDLRSELEEMRGYKDDYEKLQAKVAPFLAARGARGRGPAAVLETFVGGARQRAGIHGQPEPEV